MRDDQVQPVEHQQPGDADTEVPSDSRPGWVGFARDCRPDLCCPPEVRAATPREKIPTIAIAATTVVMATRTRDAQSMFISGQHLSR